MIKKEILEKVLSAAMSTGADFAEIFAEYTRNNSLYLVNSRIDEVLDSTVSGAGIRAFLGCRCVSASTNDMSYEGLLSCALKVAQVIAESKLDVTINLHPSIAANAHPIKIVPDYEKKSLKADILKAACAGSSEKSNEIIQTSGSLSDVDHEILVANSDGLMISDRSIRTRLCVSSIAERSGNRQSGFYGPGAKMGLELFDTVDPRSVGEEAARIALVKLSAKPCPAGKMPVAIENCFGGVIFHEACGHSLEATCVSKNQSQMCGKLGMKVANEKVTAIDDGTIPNAWGSINIDDEGTPSQRNVLIENGVLKNYMIDKLGGRRMGMASTGSSRRQSYLYEPTSRMTNTFIDNGPDKNEDIIASIEYGLLCAKMGGGSVNPINGTFNFSVEEGYIVRNGKICESVLGASLIGKGSEILMNIDMVGQNLGLGQGMCGSSSGSIPTNVGQPLIRVSSITVGGNAK